MKYSYDPILCINIPIKTLDKAYDIDDLYKVTKHKQVYAINWGSEIVTTAENKHEAEEELKNISIYEVKYLVREDSHGNPFYNTVEAPGFNEKQAKGNAKKIYKLKPTQRIVQVTLVK